MRPLFHPELVNGPFGDPALFVSRLYQRRALLFDAGSLHAFPPAKLLKVTHVFISHTHMDHFVGFDHLVRLMLGRPIRLRMFGPRPLADQVASRLASYSWNLVEGYEERLQLEVNEIDKDRVRRTELDCREGFRDFGVRQALDPSPWVCQESGFRVRAALLDHKIPSAAYCLEEPEHIEILKGQLEALGLTPGSWLQGLREAVLCGAPDDLVVAVRPAHRGPLPLGWLRERLVRLSPGQRIAYVADAVFSPANRARIASLARNATMLFIEAAFLHEDRARAHATYHLTAREAGLLAAEAGAQRVVPFHFSPKYEGDGARLQAELEAAMAEGGRGPHQSGHRHPGQPPRRGRTTPK
jgi:ribonuclease Z